MKKFILILSIVFCLFSCKSTKQTKTPNRTTTSISSGSSKPIINSENTAINSNGYPTSNKSKRKNPNFQVAENIIDFAMKFEGVRYKYGGTDKRGMDCSGLVTTAFNSEDILLPRSSSDMALKGDWIDIKEVQRGDLLFFATNGKGRNISHVALVTQVNHGQVEFIHSSTSAGVIVSSLAEKYWYYAFVQARRML